MKRYISLDIETTGFDPESDQLLELAAIKFEGDKIIDTFETLINPQTEIPFMVGHITGITKEIVEKAPLLEEIKNDFLNFIGEDTIIGHNIEFDLNFLRAKNVSIKNKHYDTLDLSGILFDSLPSYSLDTISRKLNIKHENKHRAMSDAYVCFELFNRIIKEISNINKTALFQIQNIIRKSNWSPGLLFLESESYEEKQAKIKIKKNNKKSTRIFNFNNEEKINEIYDENGPLKEIINDYEVRPGQKIFTKRIIEAYNNNHHLMVEAGTGTGKTFSYLLAACYLSKNHNQKIVISTHTTNLQDQIIHKDFEILKRLFPKTKITTLKGKKKYISINRLTALKNKTQLADFEVTAIIKILLWIEKTKTGDLDELNLQNKEQILFEEICCLDKMEKGYEEESFLSQAREMAEKADIIIVNHALLLSDAFNENKIIPEHQTLIIDEAHHLGKTTTDILLIDITPNQTRKMVEKMENAFSNLQKKENTDLFDQNTSNQTEKILYQIKLCLEEIKKMNELVFQEIFSLMEQRAKKSDEYMINLIFKNEIAESKEWMFINSTIITIKEHKAEFEKLFEEIHEIATKMLGKDDLTELGIRYFALMNLLNSFSEIIEKPDQKIIWFSKTHDENIHFQSVPRSIKNHLKNNLFDKKRSVILTSATLTTGGNFKYFKKELGLGEEFDELKLPSHFSYPDLVKIIIPQNMSLETRSQTYTEECAEIIKLSLKKNGGKTLVLFTSKKELSKCFYMLAAECKSIGINILAQNISGGRGKIIAQFKDEPEKSVIFGTNSFWEGIDIMGDDLNCVIIQKLPFDPPEDPIIKERGSEFNNNFSDYLLPRAIIRFKQGFGRLIRSAKDTGTVIILDSRLIQKKYGQEFLESLPAGIKIDICQKENINEKI